jgi:cytochrome c556
VATRVAGYKDLGAAFKGVNDEVRRGSISQIPILAKRISAAAKDQYHWFPASSGPGKGIKTAAKLDIWSNAAAFKVAQDRFAAQAKTFQAMSLSKDSAAIRSAARQLGAACKACHDGFRDEED